MNAKSASSSSPNPLAALHQFGQSVWLDLIRRSLLTSGDLARNVTEDGLGGLTSNPAIFQKAIDGSNDYSAGFEHIARTAKGAALEPKRVFELLAIQDIQDAADVLMPVYEKTDAADGYVSLEVAPDLAGDTQATINEGRRLWKEVNRPNLMIKVPATAEGLPAVAALLGEGINVNVTLLFARSTYEKVAQIFVDALHERHARGEKVGRVASVASFFVSRIDTSVDAMIDKKLATASGADKALLESLRGKVAIANAKLAYQSYKKIFASPRWRALAAAGARPQRVLWASTGTKDPKYSDVLYVEELIGPETVNTMPSETMAAFRDHGKPRASLEAGVDEATQVLQKLGQIGISLDEVTDELVRDGVKKFMEPYTKLLAAVERSYRDVIAAQKQAR